MGTEEGACALTLFHCTRCSTTTVSLLLLLCVSIIALKYIVLFVVFYSISWKGSCSRGHDCQELLYTDYIYSPSLSLFSACPLSPLPICSRAAASKNVFWEMRLRFHDDASLSRLICKHEYSRLPWIFHRTRKLHWWLLRHDMLQCHLVVQYSCTVFL